MGYLDSMSTSLSESTIPIAMSTCLGLLDQNGGYHALAGSIMISNRAPYERKQLVSHTEVTGYLQNKFNNALETLLKRAKSDVLQTLDLCPQCARQSV